MANKTLFKSHLGKRVPSADTVNEAGGVAYSLPPKHALTQYAAATDCLNSTCYASAETQLGTVLKLCGQIEPEFIARTALYTRTKGYMKRQLVRQDWVGIARRATWQTTRMNLNTFARHGVFRRGDHVRAGRGEPPTRPAGCGTRS